VYDALPFVVRKAVSLLFHGTTSFLVQYREGQG
jgi:hypothetical protein